MTAFHAITLSNGLRIIHEPSPTDIVYCGLFVDAGTKHQDTDDAGVAHFCEHTSFKGTTHRKAYHIRNRLESVGGDLNAYTNKEETVYYATIQKVYFDRAADLLFDIVFHSTFPQQELEKETEVIIGEIDCYNDSPAELIYDEFEEMVFRGHGLGRNILGNEKRLREYRTHDAQRFTSHHYIPANVTFFVYGNVDFQHIVKMATRLTADLSLATIDKHTLPLPEYIQEERHCTHHTHQAHVLLGNRVYGSQHPKRFALALLNNILGGPGMNSLLNIALREKHGLVYTAESTVFNYTEAGIWSIYFGCDENDVSKCHRLILNQLDRLTDKPLGESQLARAKRQMTGQMHLASDNFENYALALGKFYARTGKHRDIEASCKAIMELTATDLLNTAQEIFRPERLSMLVYT